MKLKIIVIIFMMLMLSVITISEKINATDPITIKVGMNKDHPKMDKEGEEGEKDKKGSTINPYNILNNWSWVVGDTEYVIKVENITDENKNYYKMLYTKYYNVLVVDGGITDHYKCELNEDLRKAYEYYINNGGGLIGRCAGSLFPLSYSGDPKTILEWTFIDSPSFLKDMETGCVVNKGNNIISERIQVITKNSIRFPWPRIPRDSTFTGLEAYRDYNLGKFIENNQTNMECACHPLTDLDKTHPILNDFWGNTLYGRNMGGCGYKIASGEGVCSLASYPEKCYEKIYNVSAWSFCPIAGPVIRILKWLLDLINEYSGGLIPIDDIPYTWQGDFEGQEYTTIEELLTSITKDLGPWQKTDKKVKTGLPETSAIIAFDYNDDQPGGKVVLTGPHVYCVMWDGGEIVDNPNDIVQNRIIGLNHWEDENGDWIWYKNKSYTSGDNVYRSWWSQNKSKNLTWYYRNEIAWISELVPDDHFPPIYNRSHVVDFENEYQNTTNFSVTCIVQKNDTCKWDWNSNNSYMVNLTLYYKWNNINNFPSDPSDKWIPYKSKYGRPYSFDFTSPNGSGYYWFCSTLNITDNKTNNWNCDDFPPGWDAKTAVNTNIEADFELAIPQYLFANTSIQFNSSKSATKWGTSINRYSWDFGDGNQSSIAHPSHKYSDDGVYNVTLEIENTGTAEDSIIRTIIVHNNIPVADFSPLFKIVYVNETVNFTDNSDDIDGVISGYSWDFGDGTNSIAQNPNHSYPASGYYSVNLEITDDDFDNDMATGLILVIDSLVNQSKNQQGNIWNKIQEAIDNSSSNSIIYVENGTYNENIYINKSITLVGEDRDNVIITGSVVMDNPYDYELPDYQYINLFIPVNMTGNHLLMHFNNDSTVGENYSGSNLVFDHSGQENNGTKYNVIWTDSTLKGAGAFDFNGNSSSINLSNIPCLEDENVTISAWVFWNGGSGIKDPIISQSNATRGYCLYVNNSSSKPAFRLDTDEVASSVTIGCNEWHHIVGTHNMTSLKIYVDGVLQGTCSKSGPGFDTDCYIGYDNLSSYFNGIVDEIAIWNCTFNDDEIKMIYDSNYGICIDSMTIRDSNIGITVCNHTMLSNCLLINQTTGIILDNSCDISINMCNITDTTIGINIVDSNPDSYYFNCIADCFIDNVDSAVVVNNSSHLYLVRDIINGSSSNLSFINCDFNNISVMYCDSPDNVAPGIPYLSGPSMGIINVSYTFSAVTNDTNGDQIRYCFDWGDGNNSGWLSLYGSNEIVNASHIWMEQGSYTVKVRAMDVFDNTSNWTESMFIIDTLPPLINSANNSPGVTGFGGNITITANITDDESGGCSGVKTVKVNVSYPDNSIAGNYSMNNTYDSVYEYVFSDSWLTGSYNYSIWACDNSSNSNISSGYSFNVSANATINVCTIKDSYSGNEIVNLTDPPGAPTLIGYEFLDDGDVLHIWNQYNSYYFNTSSGIQLTNHYDKYWTHNVLMLGYYNNNVWNLIYRTDELSGFNQDISSDDETYVNATLWKDLTYAGYDFRLAIRYHLGVDDSDLTVIPYIKNIDDENITYNLGFGWEMKDIQIANVTNYNYLQVFNGTGFERLLLNQTLDRSFTNMDYNTSIKLICINPASFHLSRNLYLSWNYSLDYKVTVKNRTGQYNAPVTLFIKIGTLNIGQEKYIEMHWLDSDNWLGIDGSNRDSECGYDHVSVSFEAALNGTSIWNHGMRETHWGIIDLGHTYNISKIRGRSNSLNDPIDVDVYISNSKTSWGTAVATGISTWQDTSSWVEVNSTDKNGRYVKIEIIDTEGVGGPQFLNFGNDMVPIQIFDVYGSVINQAPKISYEVPIHNSDGVSIAPMLNITVSDPDGDSMSISWLSNSSGSWQVFGTNNSVGNGTYNQNMSNASVNGQWWHWKVNVSDGINYSLSCGFSFYTGYESKIKNTGSTNISGYLLMQVHFYNVTSESWVVADDTVNETSIRTINVGQQLALDTIFNGIVNTSNLSGFGNGTYRVYACLRDPDGNILKCDDETELVATYEFTISYD